MTAIRKEDPASAIELAAVRSVIEAAFGRSNEADLVDKLRGSEDELLSLVALESSSVVGHILFSRMWVQSTETRVAAVALAPLAVLPECQRTGIGSSLIRQGLDMLRVQGEELVVVLGHPDYYPRFGFSTDTAAGIESPFRRESFMALELRPGSPDGVRGRVIYPAAFGI